jgi:hypothetical protein
MPMSPRTLRPRNTLHPEAASWAARVVANGGTVGTSLPAVDRFCRAIDAAGIRDRFVRLNLFCGGPSGTAAGLNACIVPLYRSQSFGGATLGGAVDTNVGPFVGGDYIETGTSGGLWYGGVGLNASKRLDTGLNGSELSPGNRHCASYEIVPSGSDYSPSVLSGNSGATMHGVGPWTAAGGATYCYRSQNSVGGNITAPTTPGFWLGSDVSSTNTLLYKNGSVAATSGTVPAGGSGNTTYQILGHAVGEWSEARLGGYSIGLSMTAGQVAAYNTAMQALQAGLGRAV